jgi:hypothetical protein
MGGQEQGSSVNAFEMLLGLLISEKLGVKFSGDVKDEDPRVQGIKESIMQSLSQPAKSEEPVIEPKA